MAKSSVVNVMAPTQAIGSRGELQGQDKIVLEGWPCEIDQISGREAEVARSTYPDATHRVRLMSNPDVPITEEMYLTGGHLEGRKFHIGFATRPIKVGSEIELLCGEDLSGG